VVDGVNRKVGLAAALSVAGPISFWVIEDLTGGTRADFTIMLAFLLIAGYFFGREIGSEGIAGCLIGPALFLAIDIAVQVARPPPEHAFMDLLVWAPLLFLFFVLSLIPAGIGITLRRRAIRQNRADILSHAP